MSNADTRVNVIVSTDISGVKPGMDAVNEQLRAMADKASGATVETQKAFTGIERGAVVAEKEIRRAGGAFTVIADESKRVSASVNADMSELGKGIIAVFSGGAIIQSAISAGAAMFSASVSAERLRTQLEFSTGNSLRDIAYLRDLTNRLGLEFNSTASAFAGFSAAARGTAMEGQKARSTFEAISAAASVMGLSSFEAQGALLAVQQMMAKGVVNAEEFRGQLGERMPIALQAGARAIGVTTAEFTKLMETGKIVSEDFLPKFAAAITEMLGDATENAAGRLDASVNRMASSWQRLKEVAGDSGFSRMLANDAGTISESFNAVADAIQQSATKGEGGLMQLANAAGVVVGRSALGAVEGVAESANAAINLLTGGVFKLSTNIDLLPDNLKSFGQQLDSVEQKLETARAEYDALALRLAEAPDNIYVKSDMALLSDYIARLREARGELSLLTGRAGGDNYGNEGRGALQRKAADDAEIASLRVKGRAYEEFFTKYSSNSEKMRAEMDAWRSQLGDLFTPEVESRIRSKFAEKSTLSKRSSQADWTGDQMSIMRRQLDQEMAEMDRVRRARDVMAQSVEGLTRSYGQRNSVAAESLMGENERRLAEALRQVAERATQAREALAQKAASMEDNAAVQAEYKRGLDQVNAAEEAQIAIERANHSASLAMQQDWTVGATNALRTYRDRSLNVADATEQAFGRAFASMEDALVDFAMTGKANFSDFARSVIAEIIRIQVRAAMFGEKGSSSGGIAGILGNLVGHMFGGGSGMDWFGAASGMTYGTNPFSQQSMMLAAQSFAGGGDTGPGARVGGLDGKGGYWAIMHPQETVIDRTLGQQLQAAPKVEVVVNNHGTPQTYRQAETRQIDGKTQIMLIAADIYEGGEVGRALQAVYPGLVPTGG